MTTTPGAEVGAGAHRRAAGNDPHLVSIRSGAGGKVSLSRKRERTRVRAIATIRPSRKPSRIPFFTQRVDASSRPAPARPRARARSRGPRGSASNAAAGVVAQRLGGQANGSLDPLGERASTVASRRACRARPGRRAAPRASRPCGGQRGKPEALLAEPEQGQRGLHRDRVRLHEVQVHEVEQPVVDAPRLREVAARAAARRGRASGPGIWFAATEMTPSRAEGHHGQGERVVAREHLEARRPVAQDLHHLAEVARGLLHRRRCSGARPGAAGWPRRCCSRCGRARCRSRPAPGSRRRWPLKWRKKPSGVGLL